MGGFDTENMVEGESFTGRCFVVEIADLFPVGVDFEDGVGVAALRL